MASAPSPNGLPPDDGRDHLTRPPDATLSAWEVAFGGVALVSWFACFALGSFVSSSSYRARLLGGIESPPEFVRVALIVIMSYTLTNIFFLVSVSSALGCMLCRWRVAGRIRSGDGRSETAGAGTFEYPAARVYLACFLRGFLLYLMAISGLLVLSTEQSVEQTTQVQYIRIGGLISAIGFASGFDPNLILKLMGRLTDFVNQPIRGG
ncbi:hypothetical protein [Tautonia plasticadhaerens]|uniref:Uncharacterized protein n=1 Tax=Tautonia plasticadhaerens TaxID=2527974 RepID=A0A518GUX0_9BACT|nr:hypothetical protein [Tautonia plasticadhaerens]QDV32384.1 hypothetical protein ElP_02160 [Tautonia plasticadhaerens]